MRVKGFHTYSRPKFLKFRFSGIRQLIEQRCKPPSTLEAFQIPLNINTGYLTYVSLPSFPVKSKTSQHTLLYIGTLPTIVAPNFPLLPYRASK